MQNFLVQGNLYQRSGEGCNQGQVKSLRLYAEIFTGQLVGGLQGICVISKLASRMVMPRGMACIFREEDHGTPSPPQAVPIAFSVDNARSVQPGPRRPPKLDHEASIN